MEKQIEHRLKELRIEKSLTQLELSEIMKCGQSSISNWENGKREIDAVMAVKFANFFDVSVDYFMKRTNLRKKPTHGLSELDKKILESFKGLSGRDRQRVLAYIEGIRSAREEDSSLLK